MTPIPWREAMATALYGPDGFYRRPEGPAGHFRTSVHASALFAAAIARLARRCGLSTVLDVGAGRGELLAALRAADPGLALHGVDVVARPSGVPADVGWSSLLPGRLAGVLVVANEWLDNVPFTVVAVAGGAWRTVLVDPRDGSGSVGPRAAGAERGWLDRWWPETAEGDRAEVGLARDEAWADVVGRLDASVAVAIDYAHERVDRVAGRYAGGTLAAYAAGRAVPPVPDGRRDLTAHVALDACAAAGSAAGASATCMTTQRAALHFLGVDGRRPSLAVASSDPAGYVARLAAAGEAAELTAPGGLGGFTWLLQSVGLPLPPLGPVR